MVDNAFYKRAELLIRILPLIAAKQEFALKGGTALNFFVHNLPRLSVDIDLTYLPIKNRTDDLDNISSLLEQIRDTIKRKFSDVTLFQKISNNQTQTLRILRNNSIVKIEPNLVIRGSVFPLQVIPLSKAAQDFFGAYIKMPCLSIPDLYGGKICAALDRQHPRDFFDIKLLFETSGITDSIRRSFIIYLASHPRPMSELLEPNLADMERVYENEFIGMTISRVSLYDLIKTREKLVQTLQSDLTQSERNFILSIKMGQPQWHLLGLKNICKLPAIRWKLLNISKMENNKHKKALEKLRRILEL